MQDGYTHANWTKSNDIIKQADSWDETSAYPYVLCTHKYPSTEFKKCNIKTRDEMHDFLAYIVVVKIKGLKSKFYNSFISASKCRSISKGYYDNGRIISADEIEICLTDVDFYFILDSYKYESYEIIESYYSKYNYLPKQFINFVLDKYVEKTKLKNVEGREVDYNIVKQLFNSTYGMSVTNNIRSEVLFFNDGDIQKEENENKNWKERELTNEEIQEALFDEKKKAFMSFSWRSLVHGFCKE